MNEENMEIVNIVVDLQDERDELKEKLRIATEYLGQIQKALENETPHFAKALTEEALAHMEAR